MGFMDLKSVNGSDKASDLQYVARRGYLQELNCGLREESNCYNTPGWMNVALIIESGDINNYDAYTISTFLDVKLLMKILKTESKNVEGNGDHINDVKRMYKSVKKFLDNKNITYG